MTGRLRSSLGGHLVAYLLFTPVRRLSTPTVRVPLALTLLALAASPALAQRGESSGGGTSQGRGSTAPAPAQPPATRTPTVEPTERRDIPQTGEEPRRADTPRRTDAPAAPRGQRDSGRTETGRSENGRGDTGSTVRTPTPTPAVDLRPGAPQPPQPPRGRRDVPAPDARTGSGRGETGSSDAARPQDRRTDTPRTGESARRGDTSQGRADASARPGVVSVPRATAATWNRTDWDRWGSDRPGYDRSGDARRGSDRYRRSPVHLDVAWPWETRFRRGAWSPRYRYRQVVYAESGWRGHDWESRYEIVTTYRQRILDASASRARLELLLDEVSLHQDGRYVGRVTRFPYDFERLRATLYRGGRIDFDRDLMVVGDIREGFELVSTRHYGGYAYASWRRGDDVRAARLDFRRQRAEFAGQSRFFDPYEYDGYAPISLLPVDADWLGDYGAYSASAYPYLGYGYDDRWDGGYGRGDDDDDGYYYGDVRERSDVTPRGATDGSDRPVRGTYDRRDDGSGDDRSSGRAVSGRSSTSGETPTLRRDSDDRYTTPGGATIRLRREAEMQRVE